MDTALTFRRITAYVAAASVVLTLAAFVIGGVTAAIGAAVGGALAIVNWFAMRFVGRRLIVANDKGRMVWGGLLGLKMLVLMIVAWGVLATGVVDPIGFSLGLGSLVLGILAGAFHVAATQTAIPQDGES